MRAFSSINHIYHELKGRMQMLMMHGKLRRIHHNKQIIVLLLKVNGTSLSSDSN